MGTESDQIHVVFFPFMAHGHLLPTLDMARLVSARGAKSTIVTTRHNAPLFTKSIAQTPETAHPIGLRIIEFPAREVGLPDGIENMDSVTSPDILQKFVRAVSMLGPSLDDLVREMKPHGLVADLFFPFANEIAAKYGIPRLVFHGTSFFAMCAADSVAMYKPYEKVSSDTEEFVLPGLPDDVRMTRLQMDEVVRLGHETDLTRLLDRSRRAAKESHGMLVNSFYELEAAYVDHYREVMGIRAWHIGPVSLCNRNLEEKAQRGPQGKDQAPFNGHECLKWLDSQTPNSVVFVCFGTTTKFSDSQLKEIALGLESSGQKFIWVVRKEHGDNSWLPEDFEERMKAKGEGLIIRGWVPQVLILDHRAVGGFVTHCGWNSALEGISSGVPMVTWPVFAEQFYNEKLITDVLRIGVPVGVKKWVRLVGDFVKSEAVERAVREIMVGERAEEMRGRAKVLGEQAHSAVEEGGSSYNSLGDLIEELRNISALRCLDE